MTKAPPKDLVIRLDTEVINGFDVFKWVSNGDTKFSTSTLRPVLQSSEATENVDETESIYITGFNDLQLRTTFIDLNNEVMNGLSNSFLKLRIVSINENPEPVVPVKAAKGAPPVVAAPAEEVLIEFSIPMFTVLQQNSCEFNISEALSDASSASFLSVVHMNVVGSSSALSFSVTADNCLAEYVLAAKFLRWESASLRAPPVSWSLHAADVIDPKAKVPATAADLRAKYLENIARLVDTQDKVAAFGLNVGGELSPEAMDNLSESASVLQQMLPCLQLPSGAIAWDKAAAAAVDPSEDIRSRADLWSGQFARSISVV